MPVTPYLFLDGRCEEAIEFYKKALGAKVEMMMRFKESPEPPQPGMCPPNSDDKIMHACIRIGDAQVMASDGRCGGQPGRFVEFLGEAVFLANSCEAPCVRGQDVVGGIMRPAPRGFRAADRAARRP